MSSKSLISTISLSAMVFALATGCSSSSNLLLEDFIVTKYAAKPATLKVSLIDKPTDLKEVHVNVDYVELWFRDGSKGAKVRISEGLGDVDLLKLQNGVQLSLAELDVPPQVEITKIRFILKEDGHYSVKMDDSICLMKTPSAQKTGLKINLKEPVMFESDYTYSMVLDFDAKKSVVVQGNGDCLLKPVLKLPVFAKVPSADVPDEGGEPTDNTDETPVTDGTDDNTGTDTDGDGYDDSNTDGSSVDNGDGSTSEGGTDYIPIGSDELVTYF